MMNETLSLIASRRSHRAYLPDQLTREQLDALLLAAVQSPSAVNRQPWHFTVVQNAQLLADINAAVREEALKNENPGPRFSDPAFNVFYHAPTVLFISGVKDSHWTAIDCGIATQNIVIAAESMGLGTVILGLPRFAFEGARAADLERALGFPENHGFVIAISVGKPADTKPEHPVGENKITVLR